LKEGQQERLVGQKKEARGEAFKGKPVIFGI
jgi:hypothetical protein